MFHGEDRKLHKQIFSVKINTNVQLYRYKVELFGVNNKSTDFGVD